MPQKMVARKPHCKMRITINCADVQGYIENPKNYLPKILECPNNSAHRPWWNTHWKRGLISDHIYVSEILIFNAYCKLCHETISYWPIFVLPYLREPLETIEEALVEHLDGSGIREIAAGAGYDPRTVSRWIKLSLIQSPKTFDLAVRYILNLIGTEILPLSYESAKDAATLLLTWLRQLAKFVSYPHPKRLMGLCNLIGKGDWDLWGAKRGRARTRVREVAAPG